MSRIHFRKNQTAGYTLVEALIAMSCAVFIMAGLISGEAALLRTFDASDRYSGSEMAAERVIDYIGIDLRRAIKVEADTNSGSRSAFTSGTGSPLILNGTNAITFTEVGYYSSNNSSLASYRIPSPLVVTSGSIVYGTATGGVSSPMYIRYKQAFEPKYGSNCIIRDEITSSGTTSKVIAEKVDNLQVNIAISGTSTTNSPHLVYTTTAWFVPSFSQRGGVKASSYNSTSPFRIIVADTVMLRNPQLP